jgi:hypothetical protein
MADLLSGVDQMPQCSQCGSRFATDRVQRWIEGERTCEGCGGVLRTLIANARPPQATATCSWCARTFPLGSWAQKRRFEQGEPVYCSVSHAARDRARKGSCPPRHLTR